LLLQLGDAKTPKKTKFFMKKNYIAPLCEDVKMDALMQQFLDIATVSTPKEQTAD